MPRLFIAGQWLEAQRAATVRAPWDGSIVGEVGLAGDAECERAVAAASDAARELAHWPSWKRRDFLRSIAQGVEQRKEALSVTIAREAGKPITLARIEVDRAVQTFLLGAEESTRLGGESLLLDTGPASEGCAGAWMRVSAGPVLAITPFNFPLNLAVHKLAPAFALGSPVVLKPPPQAPLTSLLLAEIIEAAGAPPGVFSVLPTDNARAEKLVRDDRFGVVSFTGSARVGWSLKERAGRKRVLLELGGNAAAIVERDADLERALSRVVSGGYAYAGQVCIKVQRVFVHRAVAQAFTEALLDRVSALRVCDPMEASTLCGPLIDEAQGTRVREWLDEAVARGAHVLAGGHRAGNRLTPALVENAPEGCRLVDEEVFGPVVTVHPYEQLGEAIAAIERGRYGLQAGIFTHDLRLVSQAFRSLHVGALIVNDAPTFRVDAMPYGGVKDSGLGREGVRYAIDEMSEKRLLVMRT